MVAINLEEEEVYDKQAAPHEQSYHFAMSGRAFAVITEHFPQLVQKVQAHLLAFTYFRLAFVLYLLWRE